MAEKYREILLRIHANGQAGRSSAPGSTVLSVIMLLGGAALFFVSNRSSEDG